MHLREVAGQDAVPALFIAERVQGSVAREGKHQRVQRLTVVHQPAHRRQDVVLHAPILPFLPQPPNASSTHNCCNKQEGQLLKGLEPGDILHNPLWEPEGVAPLWASTLRAVARHAAAQCCCPETCTRHACKSQTYFDSMKDVSAR